MYRDNRACSPFIWITLLGQDEEMMEEQTDKGKGDSEQSQQSWVKLKPMLKILWEK